MKRQSSLFAGSLCCLCLTGFASAAKATDYSFSAKRCGTVVVTPVPSGDANVKLYSFREKGTMKALEPTGSPPGPSALAKAAYVCNGFLEKGTFQFAATGTQLTRFASAHCTFKGATTDRVSTRATSSGFGTPSNPPNPPVNFEILHGTGALFGIQGSGQSNGSLPIADRSISVPACSTVNWNITLP